eukprot:Protomagalhaensia_wolfi_Nauph_80__2361@NODE_2550_length_1056_cov_250_516224_g1996_i0_p1_GENE_NODE_2550_length_1056_cov_250_516224_g1996_i0NODE_2550_length_1056_cov_250_516224_g1996_i0_p1_ORF_typecomplete_len275_score18_06Bax1I/PF01027_20/2_8e09_NODE_2550_length_1056_cov_250_516224_g1996_i0109933
MNRATCEDGYVQTVQFAFRLYLLLCGELCLLAGAMAIGGYDIYATVTDPSHNHGVFDWFCQHPYMAYVLLAASAAVLVLVWVSPDVCRWKPFTWLLALALPWTLGLPAPYFDRFALPETAEEMNEHYWFRPRLFVMLSFWILTCAGVGLFLLLLCRIYLARYNPQSFYSVLSHFPGLIGLAASCVFVSFFVKLNRFGDMAYIAPMSVLVYLYLVYSFQRVATGRRTRYDLGPRDYVGGLLAIYADLPFIFGDVIQSWQAQKNREPLVRATQEFV